MVEEESSSLTTIDDVKTGALLLRGDDDFWFESRGAWERWYFFDELPIYSQVFYNSYSSRQFRMDCLEELKDTTEKILSESLTLTDSAVCFNNTGLVQPGFKLDCSRGVPYMARRDRVIRGTIVGPDPIIHHMIKVTSSSGDSNVTLLADTLYLIHGNSVPNSETYYTLSELEPVYREHDLYGLMVPRGRIIKVRNGRVQCWSTWKESMRGETIIRGTDMAHQVRQQEGLQYKKNYYISIESSAPDESVKRPHIQLDKLLLREIRRLLVLTDKKELTVRKLASLVGTEQDDIVAALLLDPVTRSLVKPIDACILGLHQDKAGVSVLGPIPLSARNLALALSESYNLHYSGAPMTITKMGAIWHCEASPTVENQDHVMVAELDSASVSHWAGLKPSILALHRIPEPRFIECIMPKRKASRKSGKMPKV